IVWVFHFTNIVIQSANAAKQPVGPNSTGGGLGQVRDLQAVVKGSGCFGHEDFEQGQVGVAKRQKAKVCCNIEATLEEQYKGRGEEYKYAVEKYKKQVASQRAPAG